MNRNLKTSIIILSIGPCYGLLFAINFFGLFGLRILAAGSRYLLVGMIGVGLYCLIKNWRRDKLLSLSPLLAAIVGIILLIILSTNLKDFPQQLFFKLNYFNYVKAKDYALKNIKPVTSTHEEGLRLPNNLEYLTNKGMVGINDEDLYFFFRPGIGRGGYMIYTNKTKLIREGNNEAVRDKETIKEIMPHWYFGYWPD